jgi:hypothetical protein
MGNQLKWQYEYEREKLKSLTCYVETDGNKHKKVGRIKQGKRGKWIYKIYKNSGVGPYSGCRDSYDSARRVASGFFLRELALQEEGSVNGETKTSKFKNIETGPDSIFD